MAFAASDAQLIATANTARRLCDLTAQLYYAYKACDNMLKAQGIIAQIPATDAPILDGSGTNGDGRVPITGNMLLAFITQMEARIAVAESNGAAALNTVLAVAVNPNPGG